MAVGEFKKEKNSVIVIVKKIKDYSNETVFKKKEQDAIAFVKKNGLPKAFKWTK